jgi:hypothetical protein
MTHLRRSPVLILALIALLAACSSAGTSSATPAASSAAPAAAAAALVRGEFVGDAGDLAGIALSTNGRQVIGYLCDGTGQHVSLAQWFTGPVTGTSIDITNAHGAHLVATATAQAITGTVTLKDGRSAPFIARLLPDPGRTYGLFRSEQTFHGVRYLGGWILNPPSFASARVGAGASAGVSLTAALLPDPVGFQPLRGGIGIINEQTGALIVSPLLDNLVSVTVPGVGTFRLTHCLRARC